MDFKRVAITPIRCRGETLKAFYASSDPCRAMNIRLNDRGNYVLRRYMVSCFFDIPSVEAARIMCVSLSLLKKIRSWAKVDRWPCSQIHAREHPVYTKAIIVEMRDEVILSMENEFLGQPSSMLFLSLTVLKELREYAVVYSFLVIPDAGRRCPKRKVEEVDAAEETIAEGVRVIMEAMQPRRKEVEVAVVEECPWPLYEECVVEHISVEDELGLGPLGQ